MAHSSWLIAKFGKGKDMMITVNIKQLEQTLPLVYEYKKNIQLDSCIFEVFILILPFPSQFDHSCLIGLTSIFIYWSKLPGFDTTFWTAVGGNTWSWFKIDKLSVAPKLVRIRIYPDFLWQTILVLQNSFMLLWKPPSYWVKVLTDTHANLDFI